MFQCFDTRCAATGDVIDLWAKLHHTDLRRAALDLVQTFHLEPAATAQPTPPTARLKERLARRQDWHPRIHTCKSVDQ